MKLVVLSDIHLMVRDEAAHDLGNHARLARAIERINSAYSDADLVVFAGDLADRGWHQQSYEDLKSALTDLDRPWAVTLGNHDDREVFFEAFGSAWDDGNGFVQSAHQAGGHRVIVLDSLEKNDDPDWPHYSARTGHLCGVRLGWLEAQLNAAAGLPVIVVLHHPVWPVGIQMDPWCLRDPQTLTDMLRSYRNVRQVISGHIHMTTTVFRAGIPFTTIAGNFSTSFEDFGTRENKGRREGPAQMAVLLGDANQVTVHFDNFVDGHAPVHRG